MVHVSKELTPGVQVVGAVVTLQAASMDLLDVGQKTAFPVVGPATVRTLFEDPHGGLQGGQRRQGVGFSIREPVERQGAGTSGVGLSIRVGELRISLLGKAGITTVTMVGWAPLL